MFNKKRPRKKAAPKKQHSNPGTEAMIPAKPRPPKYEPKQPFVPYPQQPMSIKPPFSMPEYTQFASPSSKKARAAKPKFDPESEFLKTFKTLTYRHRAWDIWNDFIIMAACALSNPVDKTHYEEREARYLRIINKYNKQEQHQFPTLFAHTVMALELNPEQDFLGKLYNVLNLHDEGRKQHFTPYSVCDVMARITMEDVVDQVKKEGFVTINDPCCGAGATLIASVNVAKEALAKAALNFQNHILIAAQDIDETVALMCYIQLSLLGVAAYIKVGNTITDPMNSSDTMENYWFTPMYFSDVWSLRRAVRKMDELIQADPPKIEKKPFKLLVKLTEDDCRSDLPIFYEIVARRAGFELTEGYGFDCTKIRCTKAVQDAIFKFYAEKFGANDISLGMMWVDCGPKADLDGDEYAVEIEDGFVASNE